MFSRENLITALTCGIYLLAVFVGCHLGLAVVKLYPVVGPEVAKAFLLLFSVAIVFKWFGGYVKSRSQKGH
jgi:cellobiose-specific phosphotransferase system component IIC